MKTKKYSVKQNGFYGKMYWCKEGTDVAVLVVTDDNADGAVSKMACKWLLDRKVNVLAVSPEKGIKGCHSFPLEQVKSAVDFLKSTGNRKIGIMGASASAMIALTAASYFDEITLTMVLSPSDFVMEGYYQDKKDGADERPGDYESSLTYEGKPLPFLPYAYRHPEYWQKHVEETKRRGDLTAAKDLFDESERRHPVTEEELIKVENIHGKLLMAGAMDDVLWDTCKYIGRMKKRIAEKNGKAKCHAFVYEHGTHFIFPEGMLRKLLPVGANVILPLVFKEAKGYTKECRATRISVEQNFIKQIEEWKNQA